MKIAGIILIVIGLGLSIFSGVNYITEKKVAQVGRLEITRDQDHSVNWSPYAGVACLVAGGIIIIAAVSRKV